MTKLEILLVAIGLAMDCLAVSVASGIILRKIQWRPIFVMAFFFGFFQALMPFLGWGCASRFNHLIESFDHWIAFSILLFLGGRMILESFKEEDCKQEFNPASLKVVLTLAIATSIDALAVGISFACLDMTEVRQVLPPITAIGMVSFLMSVTGLLFGITFGSKYAHRLRAELWGGVILILIGSKILAEHLLLESL
ncbi:MAG: manganese efflux pump MntP family protein [Bacteroides sp.]|nr:manganese efflux pump MntP family protein [Bacteroides sp.]